MLDNGQIRNLVKALHSEDETTRWEAIRSVKPVETKEWNGFPADAIAPLVKVLSDQLGRKNPPNSRGRLPTLRQEMVILLGNLGPRAATAVPQLMELLGEGEAHAVREAAVTALGKIGKEAKAASDKLVGLLGENCRDTLAGRIARALGEIGKTTTKVRSGLVGLWLTPGMSESCKEQVALALCKLQIDVPGLHAVLTKALLTNSHLSSRKVAVEGLACCTKEEVGVVPALIVALHDADEEVQRLARAGLERMRLSEVQAVKLCGDQLEDCAHAEVALRKTGPLAVPTLIGALADKRPAIREKASQILGSLGEPAGEAAPALTKALRDTIPEVRLCAAKALWNITKQPDEVVPALASLLKPNGGSGNGDLEYRRRFLQSVIEALGRIGPPAQATIPALKKQAQDENRLIRESAQRTLRQIDPTSASKTAAF